MPIRNSMIYMNYLASADALDPFRALARSMAETLPALAPGQIERGGERASWLRGFWAACQIMARGGLSHKRPNFDIPSVRIGGRNLPVSEEAVMRTPFATLLRFKK